MRKRFKDLKADDIVLVGQVDFSNEAEVAGNLDVRHLANGPGDPQAVLTIDPTDYFWRGDGQWAIPGGADDGCPLYCGPGEPEGVITSVVGGIYEQDDRASTSHPLFVKRSGTGNTGWRGWAGFSGSGSRSFEIGDEATSSASDSWAEGFQASATAADAQARGRGANVDSADGLGWGRNVDINAARGIAAGLGARVDAVEGISIGDGRTLNINDISIGWSHDFGAAVAHPSILIGKNATINTGTDASSSTTANYGGHILIGEDTETPYAASQFHNTVIGYKAKARGRACIVIGDQAESRAANTPVSGQAEGRFATLIGYLVKGSGGCIVGVGDQADVRGDSVAGVGTHIRCNDSNTAAFGPNNWAGSLTSSGQGSFASALGVSCQAFGLFSTAVGNGGLVRAQSGLGLGTNPFVDTLHRSAIAIGEGPATTAPRQMMFGDNGNNGGGPLLALHFNGASQPAILVTLEGKLQFVAGMVETDSSRTFPIAASITATGVDTNLFMSTTAANRVVTLPPAGSVPVGKQYYVRKDTSGANTVRLVPDGTETIDGDPDFTLNTPRWSWAIVENDGTPGFEWFIADSG